MFSLLSFWGDNNQLFVVFVCSFRVNRVSYFAFIEVKEIADESNRRKFTSRYVLCLYNQNATNFGPNKYQTMVNKALEVLFDNSCWVWPFFVYFNHFQQNVKNCLKRGLYFFSLWGYFSRLTIFIIYFKIQPGFLGKKLSFYT